MKLKEPVIKRLRDLSRDYHAAYSDNQPLNLGGITSQGIQSYLADPRRKKFLEIVNALSKEERAELLAVVWLGRGDDAITMDNWDSLIEQAKNEDDVGTADYLIGKSPLADYIDRGLDKLAK